MGFMDKLGSLFGDSKPDITDSVKPAGQVLRENGIDTSDLKFKYNQDGSVEVSGTTASQAECDRICELVKEMPTTSEVHNKLTIGAPEPEPVPEPEVVAEPEPEVVAEPEPEVAAESEPEVVAEPEPEAVQEGEKGRSYTVQSGDTLWKISKEVYGSGNKYMKIFEANTSILDNPDKIFPGQELVIPDLDD